MRPRRFFPLALLLGALSLFAAAPAQAQMTVPAAPTGLEVLGGDTFLRLTWTAPSGTLTGYDIHYTSAPTTGTGAVANNAAVQTGAGATAATGWLDAESTTTSAFDDIFDLTNGTLYRVRVRATNAQGHGAWVFGTGTPMVPTPPTNLVVTPGIRKLDLTWTAADGAIGGHELDITSAPEGTVANNASPVSSNTPDAIATGWVGAAYPGFRETSHTITNLVPTTTYRVRLRAVWGSGQTDWVFGKGTPPSSNANLSGLTVSVSSGAGGPYTALGLTPSAFSTTRLRYTATVQNATTHAKLTPTVEDTSRATVTVDEATVTSGTASGALALSDERTNAIVVRVTAQDGITTQAYRVTITRRPRPGSIAVSLSSPDSRVLEGALGFVAATLSKPMPYPVRIPLTYTNDTAEPGDYDRPRHPLRGDSAIVIVGDVNGTEGRLGIQTNEDGDKDDETFTVALDTANLPVELTAGSPSAVQITIEDKDASLELPVQVQLWASPNPVPEGSPVTVRVLLYLGSSSRPMTVPYDVTVPVQVERGTSEEGDHGTLESITIPANHPSATGQIWTSRDADAEDETFLVSVPELPMDEHLNDLTRGDLYSAQVTISENTGGTPINQPPPDTGTPPGGGGGGGGGTPDDRHGDTPDEATSLNPRRYTTGVLQRRIDAHLQSRTDVDTFRLDLPAAGVLTASTTGGDTTGRLYQAQEDGTPVLLAEDTTRGPFEVGVAVEPGTYYLAISAGASFGAYRLLVDYTPAFVENPAPDSPQSGLGVLSGWVCAADTVEIELVPASGETQTWVPATGTSRADTASVCGADTTDTGFGLLFNWNLLGDGAHTVRVLIADILFAERAITVTTLGAHEDQEYRRGLHATTTIPDFPAVGETTTLHWEEALQNFVIASDDGGDGGGEQLTPEQARLENPAPGSFQSGLGVISGWVCEAASVEVEFTPADADEPVLFEAGAGTERADTADQCGDTDNGFGLLFNWNLLGDGRHTVRALADGDEFAHSTVTVTTLAGEFARGLRRTHEIEDFPTAGQTTTLEWREGPQNFVITGVE